MSNNKNQKKQGKKIKILVWADSPAVATGFAQVTKGIFNYLAKTGKYDITIIGINDRGGWKNPQQYPYRIFPARSPIDETGDYHGRPRLIATLLGRDIDITPGFDIVFTLNDPFILEQNLAVFQKGTMSVIKEVQELYKKKFEPKLWFSTVSYWPVDSALKEIWLREAINLSDQPVAYCNFGKKEIEKADFFMEKRTNIDKRLQVIYHGVDLKDFYPLDQKTVKDFRSNFFQGKVRESTFLVSVIARNQLRKDIPRSMKIYKEFHKRRPDSYLYIHAQENDVWGSLREYSLNWNLKHGDEWSTPSGFNANMGYPVSAVNTIYNSSNCVLSTSLGEGFGFFNMEGFATKTLVVGAFNTTTPELFGCDIKDDISNPETFYKTVRGMPFKSGSTSSEWAVFGPTDFERARPLGNVDDAVKKLIWAYDNPDKVQEITDRAYQWVQKYSWDIIGKQWDDLFTKVYNNLEVERAEGIKKAKEKPVKEELPNNKPVEGNSPRKEFLKE